MNEMNVGFESILTYTAVAEFCRYDGNWTSAASFRNDCNVGLSGPMAKLADKGVLTRCRPSDELLRTAVSGSIG